MSSDVQAVSLGPGQHNLVVWVCMAFCISISHFQQCTAPQAEAEGLGHWECDY